MLDFERDVEWELELIKRRARRMRFRGADLDDAIQEVACHTIQLIFDPAKANGACLQTVLCSVIDRRLYEIRRRAARYARRVQPASPHDPERCYLRDDNLALDVQGALAHLSDRELAVCEYLRQGFSIAETAQRLGRDWHIVKKHMRRIRIKFEALGLDAWLGTPAKEPS